MDRCSSCAAAGAPRSPETSSHTTCVELWIRAPARCSATSTIPVAVHGSQSRPPASPGRAQRLNNAASDPLSSACTMMRSPDWTPCSPAPGRGGAARDRGVRTPSPGEPRVRAAPVAAGPTRRGLACSPEISLPRSERIARRPDRRCRPDVPRSLCPPAPVGRRVAAYHYEYIDWSDAPIGPAKCPNGEPCTFTLPLGAEVVHVTVWQVCIGRVMLYLLDTDLPANTAWDRELSSKAFAEDSESQLRQSVLLGAGAVRALELLEIEPVVWHLAAGPAAMVTLERLNRSLQPRRLPGCPLAIVKTVSALWTFQPPTRQDRFIFASRDRIWHRLFGARAPPDPSSHWFTRHGPWGSFNAWCSRPLHALVTGRRVRARSGRPPHREVASNWGNTACLCCLAAGVQPVDVDFRRSPHSSTVYRKDGANGRLRRSWKGILGESGPRGGRTAVSWLPGGVRPRAPRPLFREQATHRLFSLRHPARPSHSRSGSQAGHRRARPGCCSIIRWLPDPYGRAGRCSRFAAKRSGDESGKAPPASPFPPRSTRHLAAVAFSNGDPPRRLMGGCDLC